MTQIAAFSLANWYAKKPRGQGEERAIQLLKQPFVNKDSQNSADLIKQAQDRVPSLLVGGVGYVEHASDEGWIVLEFRGESRCALINLD